MKYINKTSVLFLVILTVFGITGFVIWKSVYSKNVQQVSIENKTRAFIVESVNELGEKNNRSEVEITFKNNYDKSISAYRVRVSEEIDGKADVSAVERGGLIVGWVLKPGEIKVEKFAVNSKGKAQLTIAAVIFEDGTGDGEISELNRLQDVRVGVRMAFENIIPILQEAAKAGDSFSSGAAIQSLEERIRQLSDKSIPNKSKRGFALAKSYIGLELKDIKDAKAKNLNFNAESRITGRLAEIESALIKLSASSPSIETNRRQQ